MHDEPEQHAANGPQTGVGVRHPRFQVVFLGAVVLALSGAVYIAIPDRGEAVRDAGPWAFILTASRRSRWPLPWCSCRHRWRCWRVFR